MDKQLICAVAGSGKTTLLIDTVAKSENKRSIILTYTNENFRSIKASLTERYGRVPEHVYLTTYFSFLYSFCYRPFLFYQLRDNGYTWNMPSEKPRTTKAELLHYMTKGRYLYSNRLAKLIVEFDVLPKVLQRLERFFDCFLIDEIQDFAANDFNLVVSLSRANVDVLFVGDFFQHTFDTSRDGATKKNLHKNGEEAYLDAFRKSGFSVDTHTLRKSYRCSPTVCDFISSTIGVSMESHRSDSTDVMIVDDPEHARALFFDDGKVKLFYEGYLRYDCLANNWGRSKGLNGYGDVCVVLNKKTAQLLKRNRLDNLPASTRNKLYVACSRARGDLYILDGTHLKSLSR